MSDSQKFEVLSKVHFFDKKVKRAGESGWKTAVMIRRATGREVLLAVHESEKEAVAHLARYA